MAQMRTNRFKSAFKLNFLNQTNAADPIDLPSYLNTEWGGY